MNFEQTIKVMGYQIDEKNEEKIIIKRIQKNYTITVIFNKKLKYIHGLIVPLSYVATQKDVDNLQIVFNGMKNDIAKFQELSKYEVVDIIY